MYSVCEERKIWVSVYSVVTVPTAGHGRLAARLFFLSHSLLGLKHEKSCLIVHHPSSLLTYKNSVACAGPPWRIGPLVQTVLKTPMSQLP